MIDFQVWSCRDNRNKYEPNLSKNPNSKLLLSFIKICTKMETLNIEILNPKAKNLLKNLADLNLIKISKEAAKTDFSSILKKLRDKSNNEISLAEITKEVEEVRNSRSRN